MLDVVSTSGISSSLRGTRAEWAEAVTHLPENLRDESFEVILVELKSPPEEGCM